MSYLLRMFSRLRTFTPLLLPMTFFTQTHQVICIPLSRNPSPPHPHPHHQSKHLFLPIQQKPNPPTPHHHLPQLHLNQTPTSELTHGATNQPNPNPPLTPKLNSPSHHNQRPHPPRLSQTHHHHSHPVPCKLVA